MRFFRPTVSLLALAMVLAGCSTAAAPCKVAAAGLDVIPVIGGILSAPADGCADVIDP